MTVQESLIYDNTSYGIVFTSSARWGTAYRNVIDGNGAGVRFGGNPDQAATENRVINSILSFPRKGFTLALDFANRGDATFVLLDSLEQKVRDAGGALYPAKDARMSREAFLRSSPRIAEFIPFIDPAFSSSFWRRVSA